MSTLDDLNRALRFLDQAAAEVDDAKRLAQQADTKAAIAMGKLSHVRDVLYRLASEAHKAEQVKP